MQALLSTTYFGPVQWYQKLCRYDSVLIERCDTYRKQTYRNRCVIATANGLQALTVPVERTDGGQRLLTRDVRISDHGNWRHLHWHALMSAYSESPFFEYYADDLRPFFERRWQYLCDFNQAICETVCGLLDIHPAIGHTSAYSPAVTPCAAPGDGVAPPLPRAEAGGAMADDYRDAIDPKHPLPDPAFEPRPYYQVFARRHGFRPNLSVLDLLFNMGPEAIFWLV